MKSSFIPTLIFVFVPKLAACALFVAAMLLLPGALSAQTAEDFYKKGIHVERADPDTATADFNRAIALDPKYAPAYYHRGLMKANKKDYDGAMADYDQAIALDPNYAHAYGSRGYAKAQKRDFAGAMADCNRAIALDPKFVPAYLSRSVVEMAQKNYDGAIADCDQALTLNPKNSFAYLSRASAKQAKGDKEGAKADTAQAAVLTAPPRVKHREDPVYPLELLHLQLIGEVTMAFVVDIDGRVHNPTVISSTNPGFNQSAIDAILKWQYEPALHDGVLVKANMRETLHFRLRLLRGNVSVGSHPYHISQSNVDQSKLPPELRYDTPPRPSNTVYAVYPFELLRDGVGGEAEVAFVVGPNGRVAITRVTKATRPEFGQAAVAMLDEWRFHPAMKDGKPSSGLMSIKQHFSEFDNDALMGRDPHAHGSTDADELQTPVNDEELSLLHELKKEKPSFCSIEKLDAKPQLLSPHPPAFPSALIGKVAGGQAAVEFLIDKGGNVQLPRIVSATEPAFGYAAVQGVSQWKFAPPTSQGHPVVVRARIPVIFKSPVPASAQN